MSNETVKQFEGMTPEADQLEKGICDGCDQVTDHLYYTSEGNFLGITYCLKCLEEDP